jgi:hypothetical protein
MKQAYAFTIDLPLHLPGAIVASEVRPAVTRIALQDPAFIAAASNMPAVHAACETATIALQRVVASLAKSASSPA